MDKTSNQILFVQLTDMSVAITPTRTLALRLGKPHPSLGFDPSIVFATELTPTEAREFADLLVRKAREAEGGSSQH